MFNFIKSEVIIINKTNMDNINNIYKNSNIFGNEMSIQYNEYYKNNTLLLKLVLYANNGRDYLFIENKDIVRNDHKYIKYDFTFKFWIEDGITDTNDKYILVSFAYINTQNLDVADYELLEEYGFIKIDNKFIINHNITFLNLLLDGIRDKEIAIEGELLFKLLCGLSNIYHNYYISSEYIIGGVVGQ
jgi:hypothetical protein